MSYKFDKLCTGKILDYFFANALKLNIPYRVRLKSDDIFILTRMDKGKIDMEEFSKIMKENCRDLCDDYELEAVNSDSFRINKIK